MMYVFGHQVGAAVYPACGQLNIEFFLFPLTPHNSVSQDGFYCSISRQPAYSQQPG